jgi:hypothetical protein
MVYHKRAHGRQLARPEGAERTWTPAELALLEAIAPMIAAALHPPRWSDVRRKPGSDPETVEEPLPQASWLAAVNRPPLEARDGRAPSLSGMDGWVESEHETTSPRERKRRAQSGS